MDVPNFTSMRSQAVAVMLATPINKHVINKNALKSLQLLLECIKCKGLSTVHVFVISSLLKSILCRTASFRRISLL